VKKTKRYFILKIKYGANEVVYKIKDSLTLNGAGMPDTVNEASTAAAAKEICKQLNEGATKCIA
jgi:hypothetical protein